MSKIDAKKIAAYWRKAAKHDYDTMLALFKLKWYSEFLFFGHIVLEKILKACVVKKTKEHTPYTHDLVKLHETAELKLSTNEIDFLDEMNDYNIRARYPDYKLSIYKLCTQEYTKDRIDKISIRYKKLWKQKQY